MYLELLDKIAQHYSEGKYQEEAVNAKMEFCEFAGVMDEFAPDYEMKFNQFADWYIFTRPFKGTNQRLIDYEFMHQELKLGPEKRQEMTNLASSRHSLFEFLKLSKQDLYVRDLFSNYKITIKNSPVIHGFEKDSFFEARLIPHEDTFLFSNSFCFHPAEANKFIQNAVKVVLRSSEDERPALREELILKLFKMKHKFERYVHVKINDVYSDESRLKF